MEIEFFNRKVEEALQNLGEPLSARAMKMLGLLEKFGDKLRMPESRKIGKNLFELRVRGGNKVRIIYCFHGDVAIVLHVFIKKTQKIPKRIVILATNRKKRL